VTKAKVSLIAVGVVSAALAMVGLSYNLTTLFTDFTDLVQTHGIPYFYPAFYAMSAICIACYLVLLTCGVQFIRLRPGLLKLFVGVVVFEVVYFFSIGILWVVPNIGTSIGAATGVANGGLMFQAVILFPLWAPVLARWAARRLTEGESAANPTPAGMGQAAEGTPKPPR
jgi:hypothetical protein